MEFYVPVIIGVTWILAGAGALLGVVAFIDAAMRRAELFAAADKQSKGVWAGITGAGGAVLLFGLLGPFGFLGPQSLLWLAAVVGCLVYLVDVRPQLKEIQSGNRW